MNKKPDVFKTITQLSDVIASDQKIYNDTFGEFKMSNVPEKKQFAASRVFNEQELDALKPDFGSVIDRIKSKKR
jgi:hypothetical protein